MPLPIAILAVSALGLGGVAFATYKAFSGPSGAELDAMAKDVSVVMPRGERAFKPELAQGVIASLASRFYDWPEYAADHRVVALKPNLLGSPISKPLSALGWLESLNSTQSILALLTVCDTDATGPQFLRAVAPGTESDYAGAGKPYAVLAYVGTLDKSLAAPGMPPTDVSPSAPVMTTDLERAHQELSSANDLLLAYDDLIQNGSSATGDDQMAAQLLASGFVVAPQLLHLRANDLRLFHGQGPQAMPAAAVITSALDAPPAFHPGVADDTTPAFHPGVSDEPLAVSGVVRPSHSVRPGQRMVKANWRPARVATPQGKMTALREGPGRGDVLVASRPGAVVHVTGRAKNGWVCAHTNGKTGWMLASHLLAT